jgi:hypothetical protein
MPHLCYTIKYQILLNLSAIILNKRWEHNSVILCLQGKSEVKVIRYSCMLHSVMQH